MLIFLGSMQLKRSMHLSTACHSQSKSPREQFSPGLRQTHILKEALRFDARFGCLRQVPGSSLKETQHLKDGRLISLVNMDMFGSWRPPRLVSSSHGCMELVNDGGLVSLSSRPQLVLKAATKTRYILHDFKFCRAFREKDFHIFGRTKKRKPDKDNRHLEITNSHRRVTV